MHLSVVLTEVLSCWTMQFGFRPGRGTTDAIFIIRQVQEKCMAKNKELWIAFVDLEEVFDRVPREVLWWALRRLGIEEWIMIAIKALSMQRLLLSLRKEKVRSLV